MAIAALLIPLTLAMGAAVMLACAAHPSWRDAAVWTTVLTALWAALGAELLSLGHWLAYGPLVFWWLAPAAALALVIWRRRGRLTTSLNQRPRPSAGLLLILAPTAAILLFTLVVAALTPPTTWDAHAYHLPRQLLWMMQHGVQHFPASDLRQLEMPPLAEFIGAELMILARGDRGANLVQWACFALSAAAASAIARDLGAGRLGQGSAALLVVTLPSAATQAVNAKNDLVVGFLALAFLQVAVQIWNERRCGAARAAMAGVTLGLLLLAKGTGAIVGLPIGIVLAAAMLRAIGWRAIPLGALALGAVVAINAGHWARNSSAFGSPIGLPVEQGGYPLLNTAHSPGAIASNLLRNAALQLGAPWPAMNAAITRGVERAHAWLGLGVTDVRTTSLPTMGFRIQNDWTSDGRGPAPIHLVLVLVSAMVVAVEFGRRRALAAWPVYATPAGALIVFCLVLSWQPWHNRLLIPVFLLAAPCATVLLERRARTLAVLCAALVLLVWPSLLLNQAKAIVGRRAIWTLPRDEAELYVDPQSAAMRRRAVDHVDRTHPNTVGIECDWGTVYPLMRDLAFGPHRVANVVLVHPHFGPPLPAGSATPDVIVSWPSAPGSLIVYRGFVYNPVSGEGGSMVYERAEAEPVPPADPISGWSRITGLDASERRATGTHTTLEFDSDASSGTLVIQGRGDGMTGRAIDILVNGASVGRLPAGTKRDTVLFRSVIGTRVGPNRVELAYSPPARPGQHPFTFDRITFAPTGPKSSR